MGLAPLPAGPGGGVSGRLGAPGPPQCSLGEVGSSRPRSPDSQPLLPQTRDPDPTDHLPTASAGQILHIMSRKGKVGGRMRPITPAGTEETGHRPRGEGEGGGG